jgi:hypothetical protein
MKGDMKVEVISQDSLDRRHEKRAAERKAMIHKAAREADSYKYDPANTLCDYAPGMDQDA